MSNPAVARILLITARADVGGAPQHLLDLAHFLKSKNVVFYMAFPDEGAYGELFKEVAYKYLLLPHRALTLEAVCRLFSFVKSENIDVVHSHGRGAGFYSRILRLFWEGSIIHTFHGIHVEKSFCGRVKFAADKIFAPFANRYICVSEDEREKALRLNIVKSQKIVVINNGVNARNIRSCACEQTIESARESFGIHSQKAVVGMLTRLDRQKGLDIFLSYIAKWKDREDMVPFDLYIAGDGEEREKLLSLSFHLGVEDIANFVGSTQNSLGFLRCLDIYTSFSLGEGCPLAVLEAMSVSLPCLLSDVTGHRGLTESLFCLENFEDFQVKMQRLIDDEKLRGEVGQRGWNTVLNNYTLDKMGEETLSLYQSSLAND